MLDIFYFKFASIIIYKLILCVCTYNLIPFQINCDVFDDSSDLKTLQAVMQAKVIAFIFC